MSNVFTEPAIHPLKRFLKKYPRSISVLLLLLPLFILLGGVYFSASRDLTDITTSRAQTTARLIAITIQAQVQHLIDMTAVFAKRSDLREFIRQNNWEAAVTTANPLTDLEHGYFINRITLSDPKGKRMSESPAEPGLIGRDFSYRDWYQGVSKNWQPYLSAVYKPIVSPQGNVTAISAPISNGADTIIGILTLQINLDKFLGWINQIGTSNAALISIVDQKGQIAFNPNINPLGPIANRSNFPGISEVIKGESGFESFTTPDYSKHLVAYEPITPFGWGVVVEQPYYLFLNVFLRSLLLSLLASTALIVVYITLLIRLLVPPGASSR